MPAALVLHDAMGSPCARRVRIVLIEKGFAWLDRPSERRAFRESEGLQPAR